MHTHIHTYKHAYLHTSVHTYTHDHAKKLKMKIQVNLGIGAYRDSSGNPLVLKCVRVAEQKIANDSKMNKVYI